MTAFVQPQIASFHAMTVLGIFCVGSGYAGLGVGIMATARVTEEGYIELPKDLREKLHLHAGDTLEIQMEKDRVIRMHPKTLKPSDVSGFLASKTHIKLSIEEMDEVIAEAFRKGEI